MTTVVALARGDKKRLAAELIEAQLDLTDKEKPKFKKPFEEIAKEVAKALDITESRGRAWVRWSVREGNVNGVNAKSGASLWPTRVGGEKKAKDKAKVDPVTQAVKEAAAATAAVPATTDEKPATAALRAAIAKRKGAAKAAA